jgi:hypothetical protein
VADPVVLVVPTVQDGMVVRWYRDLIAARNGRMMASASRNGVTVDFAPRAIAEQAYEVSELLAGNRAADVSHLATHDRGGFRHGELVPIGERPAPVTPAPAGIRIEVAEFGGAPR